MMTPESKIRVSILERLVPALAFALAALSGAVGVGMAIRFFALLRQAESAGYAAFFGGMAEIELVVGGVLVFSAVLCAIGILISIIRLFTANKTSSPPALLFLVPGILSLIPPFALHCVLHMIKESVRPPAGEGVSAIADTFMTFAPFAIGGAGLLTLILLAFSFIPIRSRPGRKASPLVCLMLVEILIAVLAGVYFWEARHSFADRDRGVNEATRSVNAASPDPHSDEQDVELDALTDDDRAYRGFSNVSNLNTTSPSKTISGGVLNSKALSLPQPAYPPAARAVSATGSVTVQVLVDEKGEVITATALTGHPLLRAAAVQAARQARFPKNLSGTSGSMSGVLTYNFSAQ